MDPSSAQSTSKCNSDFSIERILSDDSKNKEDKKVPDWLCCTRYRPPRLPRAVNSGCRSRRSGRHARVPFTATQAAALEAAYSRAAYLAPPALRALAAALQLRDDRIKIWFQNRRARERREKCANIRPPVAVTLPPTSTSRTGLINNSVWFQQHNFGVSSTKALMMAQNEANVTRNIIIEANGMLTCGTDSESFGEIEKSESPLDVETVEH
uniref:Homeobox domain-containing protein n=1 Tax=Bombyx mori TaxID=7091 RepID=A0A8R2RBJ7_BOMMO|nr:homeobox protein MSH-B isoform X2 [Bombyx mori]